MNTFYCSVILAILNLLALLILRRGMSPEQLGKMETIANTTLKTLTLYLLAGLICMILLCNFVPSKEVKSGPWILTSARSNESVQGSFVWGTGTVNGALTYHVYVKNDDGSVTPYQIAGDNRVKLIEDASLTGIGYWQQTTLVDDRTTAISRWTCASPRPDTVIANEIRVPVGTVHQSFDLK